MSALGDIGTERRRQIEVEGRTLEHDDEYVRGEMALAAAAYAGYSAAALDGAGTIMTTAMTLWPWDWCWWKPKDYRRNLVRAGALIVAEIERIDRLDRKVGRA